MWDLDSSWLIEKNIYVVFYSFLREYVDFMIMEYEMLNR